MKKFRKKVVVITGGGRGIGQEIANEFFKKNYLVYTLDKKFSQSKSLVNYKKIKADMTKFNQIKKILKKISLSKGCIDVLINCAGITQSLKKNNLLDYWETTIKNNLTSAFMASMYALPYLKKEISFYNKYYEYNC